MRSSLEDHERQPVGELLRQWREQRRMSQLSLANQTQISARHLSFLETGRSTPSRVMVLRLSDQLGLSLRERNRLLLAAGHAPVYSESAMDAPEMAAVREAVRRVLVGHEPLPAVVMDRRWNMVDANSGITLLAEGIPGYLRRPPVNIIRISLHPQGLARRIENLPQWRAHLLGQLRRQIAMSGDPVLVALLEEVGAFPGGGREPDVELDASSEIAVPLRLRHEDGVLSFFSTVATFGTAVDVTVSELSIESFFPADGYTGAVVRELAGDAALMRR
jgi:transcriptional regulator with XRE-family HTH domain